MLITPFRNDVSRPGKCFKNRDMLKRRISKWYFLLHLSRCIWLLVMGLKFTQGGDVDVLIAGVSILFCCTREE